jgi:Flp pilus assembly protein TadG
VSPPNWKDEGGAAAVEFAVIMILLLIIVFGIVEFGIAFSRRNVYIGAAREGARYAAVHCSPSSPCDSSKVWTRISGSAVGYLPATPPASFTVDRDCSQSDSLGHPVTVQWQQPITVNIPFIPGMNPATFTMTAKGVFRCE